jgi:AcrR family transcriptional regulator
VLDAAIAVLGGQGSRALTHRAVDVAGGLPAGTASNHFRSRDALLAGVLQRLLSTEIAAFHALAEADRPAGPATLVANTGAMMRHLAGPARHLTLARHAIFLEAAWRPELREALLARSAELWDWAGRWLAAVGSRDPVGDAKILLAYMDGALVAQVCRADPADPAALTGFDPERGLGLLLDGLLR